MKHKYSVDLISTHSGFMGKFELDLIIVSVGNTDFSYQVLVRDDAYQSTPFIRNFSNFRQARSFFQLCLEQEQMMVEINDLYTLAKEFFAKQYAATEA